MRKATDFGITLFSQSSVIGWQWEPLQSANTRPAGLQILLLPGLVKTTDEKAQNFGRPQEIVAPRMVVITGD